jgi:hypothetical protein
MEELAYKIKADFLGALAHPLRLQVIEFLKGGEKNTGNPPIQSFPPPDYLEGNRHIEIAAAGNDDLLRYRRPGYIQRSAADCGNAAEET